MNRRKAIGIVVGAGIATKAHSSRRPALPLSRLKQSVCRWCYQDVPLDVLCREAKKIGLSARAVGKDEPIIDVRSYTSSESGMASLGEIADFNTANDDK